MADSFANKGTRFAGRHGSFSCCWRGSVELSWCQQHHQPLDIFSTSSPPPHPLLSAFFLCCLPVRETDAHTELERQWHLHHWSPPKIYKDSPDNGVLSNVNHLKLIASSSSVAKLTCYENHQHSFWSWNIFSVLQLSLNRITCFTKQAFNWSSLLHCWRQERPTEDFIYYSVLHWFTASIDIHA